MIFAPATRRSTMHNRSTAAVGRGGTSIVNLQMELTRLSAMKSITGTLAAWWADNVPPFNPRQLQRLRKFIGMEAGSTERRTPRKITNSHPRLLNTKRSSTDRTASSDSPSSIMFRRPRVHIQRVIRQMAIHQVSRQSCERWKSHFSWLSPKLVFREYLDNPSSVTFCLRGGKFFISETRFLIFCTSSPVFFCHSSLQRLSSSLSCLKRWEIEFVLLRGADDDWQIAKKHLEN